MQWYTGTLVEERRWLPAVVFDIPAALVTGCVLDFPVINTQSIAHLNYWMIMHTNS